MARKAGLGRGLDALFADVAPINEDEYNADNLKGLSSSTEETAKGVPRQTPEKMVVVICKLGMLYDHRT